MSRRMTPRLRTGFQVLSASITGVAAFAAVSGTGVLAGAFANAHAQDVAKRQADAAKQAAEQAAVQPAPARPVVLRRRAHRTVVHTVVISTASSPSVTSVGSGGYVRPAPVSYQPPSRPVSHTSTTHSAPKPAPAPAPTSGS